MLPTSPPDNHEKQAANVFGGSVASKSCFLRWLAPLLSELEGKLHQSRKGTHSILVVLDEFKVSYFGWRVDFEKAEKRFHLSRKSELKFEVSFKKMVNAMRVDFKKMAENMKDKQQLFDGCDSWESKNTEDSLLPLPYSICMSSRSTHACVTCGHFCLCGECTVKTMDSDIQCPICRQPAQTSIKIFCA